ncbi:hypothetical protein SADUNF_Sadunf08G0074600 [Salix dunnii]|uniref:Nodulin-related protein 1 n=1 Tax=Salix dunnii TaxID=1413687 RepID=A0A835MUF8_9ROSI|nr:hypothetical protein SADUNF_Sadunf08G0074600 [Salix dunnii]
MDSAPKDKPAEHGRQTSASELLASAKLVAEAAQASLGNGRDKIDKVKVAAAAEDLLGAASKYGKMEEKGLGQYIEKAENYLHHYHSSSQPTTTPSTTGSGHTAPVEKQESSVPPSTDGNDGKSGSDGLGGAFKMAQGFFK